MFYITALKRCESSRWTWSVRLSENVGYDPVHNVRKFYSEYFFLNKKLKNVRCEYDRLNSWNSTLQAAWYVHQTICRILMSNPQSTPPCPHTRSLLKVFLISTASNKSNLKISISALHNKKTTRRLMLAVKSGTQGRLYTHLIDNTSTNITHSTRYLVSFMV